MSDPTENPPPDPNEPPPHEGAPDGTAARGAEPNGADQPNPTDREGGRKAEDQENQQDMIRTCPVRPLGHRDGKFWFLNPAGEVAGLASSQLRDSGIDGLFLGDDDWLRTFFGYKKGDGIKDADARRWLMSRCRHRGIYNPELVRGTGAWRGPAGGLILHLGSHVVDEAGVWHPGGAVIGRHIYRAAPAMPAPAAEEATAAECRDLVEFLETWNWRAPDMAPILVLGWIGASYLGGALDWRPHIMISGGEGTGKTWLQRTLLNLFGRDGVLRGSMPTEAGVRAALESRAIPVMIDENEQNERNDFAETCIELARLGSTRNQAPVLRSNARQESIKQGIDAAFLFSAINPPILKPQDAARITRLDLDRFNTPEAADVAHARSTIEAARALGPRLRARIVAAWPRYAVNFATYEAELIAQGCTSHLANQYGTLLAWAGTLLSDAPVAARAAADMVAELDPSHLIPDRALDSDDRQCLNHLMTWPLHVQYAEGREWLTISEILYNALTGAGRQYERELARHGILIRPDPDGATHEGGGPVKWLIVANQNVSLGRVYRETRWRGGAWKGALEKIHGARVNQKTVRFAGVTGKGVWLPESVLPDMLEDAGPVNEDQEADL